MTRLIFALVAITVFSVEPVTADEIHELVRSGNIQKVKELLAKNPKLSDTRNDQERTPLILALRNDQPEIAKLLLELGADVDATGFDGDTPLLLTADPEIVKLILARKPNLEAKSGDQTPLQRAASNCRQPRFDPMNKWRTIAKLLIDAGANYDLVSAINLDDPIRVKAIFKENPKQALDSEVFEDAIQAGRTAIVKLFLEHKANPRSLDARGLPLLYFALKHADVVRLLVEFGANPKDSLDTETNAAGPSGTTLLHHAAQEGYLETAKVLLASGIDAECRTTRGDTPLACAAYGKQPEMVKFLLQTKPNIREGDGRVAMAYATTPITSFERMNIERSKAIVALLRDAGIPVEISTEVVFGNVDRVRQMLKDKPALASSKDVFGYPVLSRAIWLNNKELVVLLLKAGAEIEVKNDENWSTPLHIAAGCGHDEIVKLLLARQANLGARRKDGFTPLHEAVRYNHPGTVRLLLDSKADVNAEDNEGFTPLAHAKGRKEMIALLKKYGAE